MPSTTSGIDPRGPRFVAVVTAVVHATVLLTAPGPDGVALLAAQVLLFAWGAAAGVQQTPVSLAFRTLVRPRLDPPDHHEDPAPPRFAQGVGLAFAVVALAGFLTGLDVVGFVATGFALVAALLNAVVGLCLGCEVDLLLKRLQPVPTS